MEPKKHKISNKQIALQQNINLHIDTFWNMLHTTLGRTTVVLFLLLRRTSLWNTCEASLEKENPFSTSCTKNYSFKHWSQWNWSSDRAFLPCCDVLLCVLLRKCWAGTWFYASWLNWRPLLSLYFLHTTKLGIRIEMWALHSKCRGAQEMEFRRTKWLEKSCIRHQKEVYCFTGRSSGRLHFD